MHYRDKCLETRDVSRTPKCSFSLGSRFYYLRMSRVICELKWRKDGLLQPCGPSESEHSGHDMSCWLQTPCRATIRFRLYSQLSLWGGLESADE